MAIFTKNGIQLAKLSLLCYYLEQEVIFVKYYKSIG